jgi:hypothetical protein
MRPMQILRSIVMAFASLIFLVPAFTWKLDPNASLLGQIIGRAILAGGGLMILYVEWWTLKNRSSNGGNSNDAAIE